jgi:hypothetical protein
VDRKVPLVATALALALGVLYFRTGGVTQQAVYHTLSGASAVSVLVGMRLYRPDHRTPWLLLSAGLAVMTVADITGDMVRADTAMPPLTPSVLYLVAWLLLIQAIRRFASARVPGGDRDAVLDAVAVVIAVGLVLWGVILDPALRDQGLAAAPAASIAVFPLAQAGLLALYLRLLFAGAGRLWSAWVMCLGGGVGGLLGSSAYVLLSVTSGYDSHSWSNALWMLGTPLPAWPRCARTCARSPNRPGSARRCRRRAGWCSPPR